MPLPHVDLPELVLLPAGELHPSMGVLSLKPFGFLVAAAVYLGARVALNYGAKRGLSSRVLGSFVFWVVLVGFVGGHVFDVIFYDPERLREDPLALLRLWDGLSSFGGFTGAAMGAFLWRSRYKSPILPYADAVAAGLPLGWVFGRAGCAVVHDHPGLQSTSFFAVNFPDGPRFDLGLLEMLLTILIALGFWWLQRRAYPWGFFVAVLGLVYAPLRFALDFLRVHEPERVAGVLLMPDARYAGLTPAQWACLALFGFGAWRLQRTLRNASEPEAFRAPAMPAAFAAELASGAQSHGAGQDPRD